MAHRLRRMLSFRADSSQGNIVNSNEQRTGPIFKAPSPDNYINWSLPRIEIDTIYKIGTFDFIKAYSCKTHEEVISLQNGLQTIDMIKQSSVNSHLQAKYRFMHIGLVQVAIKPLLKKVLMPPFTWPYVIKDYVNTNLLYLQSFKLTLAKVLYFSIVILILWLI